MKFTVAIAPSTPVILNRAATIEMARGLIGPDVFTLTVDRRRLTDTGDGESE